MNKLFNNDITLHRDSHTYQLLDDSNVNFKSVTTFIGDFFEEFDAKKISTKLVKSNIKYMHLTVEELMAQWTKASEYGTLVHEELEHFILHKTPVNELKSKQGVQWLKNYIVKSDFEIYSEAVVYSKELKLAGTIDLLLLDKKTGQYNIMDWKTSKRISSKAFRNKKGNHAVTSNIDDCNFNHYSLQLSLYRYILETYYGFNIAEQMVIHLEDNRCTGYHAPYMKGHIIKMLEYNTNQLKL